MKQFPFISVITPTLNNEKDIRKYLEAVDNQKYPRNRREIIISDGGSTDRTLEVAKKYDARIIKNPYIYADPGVNLGIKAAKGDILMILACDNIYEDRDAFVKIVKVFDDKKIMAAFPIHSSSKQDSIFTKYINAFTDPFNHFVYGYASNGATFKKIYKTLESNNVYDVYDFSSNKDKPLIAVAQGFTIRKGFSRSADSEFDDVLPVLELISKKKKIAFVYSVRLYHHTVRDIKHFVKKQTWGTINALQNKNYGISHRQNYLSEQQQLRIKIWPFYALSFVFPFFRSIYHLVKDREILWIFHPFLCMISASSSIWGVFLFIKDKNYEFKR